MSSLQAASRRKPRVCHLRHSHVYILLSMLFTPLCAAQESGSTVAASAVTFPPAPVPPAAAPLSTAPPASAPLEIPLPASEVIRLPPVEDVELHVPTDLDAVPDTRLIPIPTDKEPEASTTLEADVAIDLSEEQADDEEEQPLDLWVLQRQPFRAYRQAESGLAWLPGNGQNFGLVEWRYAPYLERDEDSGLKLAFNMTWLSGPHSVPLPARVYEFSAGYQKQGSFSHRFSYDVSARVGVFSDFDGSAREGVRFPSHAVGMFHINPCTDLVFGADYLDRDDISVLPVFGVSYRPPAHPAVRLDLIFPRPRIDYAFSDSHRMYLTGRLGGDTWDVDDGIEHVVTYRDYRLMIGFQTADDDGDTSSVEFGYVFGREMELRGQPGETSFDDAFVIRFVSRM